MNKVIINSNLWSFNTTDRTFNTPRGHKYHMVSTSSLPLVISFAILFFVIIILLNLHPSFTSPTIMSAVLSLYDVYLTFLVVDWFTYLLFLLGFPLNEPLIEFYLSPSKNVIDLYLMTLLFPFLDCWYMTPELFKIYDSDALMVYIWFKFVFNSEVMEQIAQNPDVPVQTFLTKEKIEFFERLKPGFEIFCNTNKIFTDKQLNQIYIFWGAPFSLFFGIFLLWCCSAIEEGIITGVTFRNILKKNFFLPVGHIYSSKPLNHNNIVRKGFKAGFIIFIISEVMFFFGFFWAFFHSALSPVIQIGAVWPPVDTIFITVKGFAVANTVILLTSGLTLTVAHYTLELVPQKRHKLNKTNNPWIEQKHIYTKNNLEDLQRNLFGINIAALHKIKLPFISFFASKLKSSEFLKHFFLNNPIFLLTPIQRFFGITLSLYQTELLVKWYVNVLLNLTIMLAFLFMGFQITEYFISLVHINTGIYGSTFYLITGLHGLHVFIGTCFLIYCRLATTTNRFPGLLTTFYSLLTTRYDQEAINLKESIKRKQDLYLQEEDLFPKEHSSWYYGKDGIESFECAAWYWHFVDVVWILVFAFVYVWSHSTVLDKQ